MGRTGAFIGGVLGLPAGIVLGTLLSSFAKKDSAKGKVMVGSMMLSGVVGAVIGAGCDACPPAGTCPPCPQLPNGSTFCGDGTVWNPTSGKCFPGGIAQ